MDLVSLMYPMRITGGNSSDVVECWRWDPWAFADFTLHPYPFTIPEQFVGPNKTSYISAVDVSQISPDSFTLVGADVERRAKEILSKTVKRTRHGLSVASLVIPAAGYLLLRYLESLRGCEHHEVTFSLDVHPKK